MANGNDYAAILEEYERKLGNKSNYPAKDPADIAQAFKRAEKAVNKKPRLKPQGMKGKC